MAKSKSSRRWLNEHFDDHYVRLAQKEGYRGRAAFKLKEIQDKYFIIRKGMRVVDLGAAPGAWCQVVLKETEGQCALYALDLLDIEPLQGVNFIHGDFTEDEPLEELEASLGGKQLDLVLSDMAPNMSGMNAVDQPRGMYLAELALQFAIEWLRPGGDFLVKMFQGEGSDAFLVQCREAFDKVMIRKPKSSRPRSREVYVLGRGRKLK